MVCNANPNFNSHAHVERDTAVLQLVRITKISTHTLTWSVTEGEDVSFDIPVHFNSHAHVERDKKERTVYFGSKISTHTLTWSVTLDVVYIWCLLNVMRTYFFI